MRDCIMKIKVRRSSHVRYSLSGWQQRSSCLNNGHSFWSPTLMLQKDEVDAVSLDATHTFIAGKCGLVPIVTEYYGMSV